MISTLPTIPSEAIERALDEIDQRRQLPAWLVDELIAANLFRLYTPAEHGGLELDPVAFCEVIEDVSALDASVGWCVWNGNCGFAAPLLNTAAAACAFQDGRPVGNSARVAGAAQIVPGGYRLSGRWDLVSGSDHQPWLILLGIVMDGAVPRMIG